MEVGTNVYVRWNGSVVQGEVVANNRPNDALFSSMVHIRIPIQGVPAVAMFTPYHVYATADAVPGHTEAKPLTLPVKQQQPAEDWLAEYRAFLSDHWDAECNHIQIAYLEDAYQLFLKAATLKNGHAVKPLTLPVKQQQPRPAPPVTATKPLIRKKKPAKTSKPVAVQLTLNFEF